MVKSNFGTVTPYVPMSLNSVGIPEFKKIVSRILARPSVNAIKLLVGASRSFNS